MNSRLAARAISVARSATPMQLVARIRDRLGFCMKPPGVAEPMRRQREKLGLNLPRLVMACGVALTVLPAAAQEFPTRGPIKVVVGFPPGGGADIFARIISEKMAGLLGQTFVVENKPGANGNLAANQVAKSPADGYTLLFVANTHVSNGDLYTNLPYDPMKDLVPVSLGMSMPLLLVASPSFPPTNVPDMLALAKASPGKVTYATPGRGAPVHLIGEMFKSLAGVDIQMVHYKGAAPAQADVMGGHVNMQIATFAQALPQVAAGKLKVLAQTGLTRSAQAPNIPTIAEAGIPGFHADAWFAMVAPANVPAPIIARLNQVMNQVLSNPEMTARLRSLGAEAMGGTPEQAAALMRSDQLKWRKVIKEVGITAE